MPAEPPEFAIIVSSVSWFGVSHRTRANEVKEKMKQSVAAHKTAGPIIGNQRLRIRDNLFCPAGKNRICSSHVLSIVDKVGSTNRIINEMLNHT